MRYGRGLADAELASTPLVEHRLPIAEEQYHRAKAVHFIIQAENFL
jgi:hypothetical protein